jgi:hypothetical protein
MLAPREFYGEQPVTPDPPPFKETDLVCFKYFKLIRPLLARLHDHKDHPNRKLHYDEYASLLLLYFFNPIVSSLRGIQFASQLRKVKRTLGVPGTSLGSLSEASHVFDPDLLAGIFRELADHVEAADAAPRPKGLPEGLAVIAADGTLLEALPKMIWALWLDDHHRAVKVHMQFDVLRGVPVDFEVTHGQGDEKAALEAHLAPNRLYVLDRGYAEYAFFQRILDAQSSFLGRVRDNAVYDLIEERPVSEEAAQAGVLTDRVVRLGGKHTQKDLAHPVRLVKIHVKNPPANNLKPRMKRVSSKKTFRESKEEYDLLLVTDRMDVSAEVIALLYRYRWQVELFFRWLKCVLGCRHLLAESERGLRIQLYAAMIASLLIVLWTGRKPTKRTLEMLQFYFAGIAELDEVEAHIARLQKTAV